MSDAKTPAAVQGDHIGVFPSRYDTDALPERRTAAFARILGIVAAVEGCVIIALAFSIAAILPLQKVVPMVVAASPKGDMIVHLNPASFDSPTIDYVAEISLRDYVAKRYSIVASQAEQAINWGLGSVVQLMSSPEVYTKFQQSGKPEYDRLRAASMTRSVRIDSVRKLNDSTWQVEWVSTDVPDQNGLAPASGQGESHSWVTTFDVKFEPKNVTYNQRLTNPFGVTITSVNDARRD